jgi:AcrR family transcriptional regulator
MAAKRRNTARPRKRPQQERSRSLVEGILAAAARVFVKEGYARATTNRIAEAAGVSVGSLYQYYPSKDAIAVELLRDYRATVLLLVERHLAALTRDNVEVVVGGLMTALLLDERINPALHRVLIEQVVRTSARVEIVGFEEDLEAVVAAAFRSAGLPIPADDVPLAAFVVTRVALGMIHAAVVDRPEYNTARLAAELTRLVVGYLARGGDPS